MQQHTGPSAEPSGRPSPALEFDSGPSRVTLSCVARFRVYTFHDQVRTSRSVSLTGVRIGGDAFTLRGAWVAPLAPGEVSHAGVIADRTRNSEDDYPEEWEQRMPARGAQLEADREYQYFVRVLARPGARFSGFRFGWTDGGRVRSSVVPVRGRTTNGCSS